MNTFFKNKKTWAFTGIFSLGAITLGGLFYYKGWFGTDFAERTPQSETRIIYKELKDKVFDGDCTKYKDHSTFSILGKASPIQPLRNCIAKAVDEGLKPICDQEKQAKKLLDHYKNQGDKDRVKETEEYLLSFEEVKYEMVDYIYKIADEFDRITEDVLDEIEDHKDKSLADKLFGNSSKIVVKSELGGFTRLLDTKARMACGSQIDFSIVNKRRK